MMGFRTAAVVLLLMPGGCSGLDRAAAGRPPNVLVLLADDLGYSDPGCYGGEIRTPNLDALARGGLRFSQFYNTARCWPSRASLLTGYYPQQVRRDTVPGVESGTRGKRPAWAPLLSARLRPLGYRSYHSGKWHVDGTPLAEGFDRSYWLEDCGRHFGPRRHFEDDRLLPPADPASGYYSTAAVADHAIRTLKEHAASHAGRPFFHYVCFTSPHFPLQAPPGDIDRYRGAYRDGWEAVREARGRRVRDLGLADHAPPPAEREVGPPYAFPDAIRKLGPGEVTRPVPWPELDAGQRDFQAAKMEVHAAMVDRMDREIGRILGQLRAMGAFEDTLVLFLSDNGASAEIMVRDDGHDPQAPAGSAPSHLCLGPGWSTASNTPFRRHKTWVHEGGISTPFIAHWPAGISARGAIRTAPSHVVDIVPTVLELAGAPPPDGPPAPGRSLLPVLIRDEAPAPREIWWLHEGNRAIRAGDWKLVAAKTAGTQAWELYDLAGDRGETLDLSSRFPEKARDLAGRWERAFEEIRALAVRDPPR